jgi:hypothetical protein
VSSDMNLNHGEAWSRAVIGGSGGATEPMWQGRAAKKCGAVRRYESTRRRASELNKNIHPFIYVERLK